MNRLSIENRAQVLTLLVEGNSIASACRITGVAKNTVLKLVQDIGHACAAYQDRVMRGLNCRRLQLDEQWAFVGMKSKNVPLEKKDTFGYGDVYVWLALDADTKLIPCWHVGPRDADAAYTFIHDLAPRLNHRVQIVTDGLRAYIEAIGDAFGADVDFAQLVKLYGRNPGTNEARYSPAPCIGTRKKVVTGYVARDDVSTSHVERANLSMRMHNRRFTRLTNAFSKKLDNHMHAISLHFMFYNFCRVHQTLRVTPAMQAGLTDHIWAMKEVVEMSEMMSRKVVTRYA
jgi:IS1 family transposase